LIRIFTGVAQTDVISRVESVINKNASVAGVFSEIGEHAPVVGIRKGVEALGAGQADGIVAVGGGSPIDASKAIVHFYHEANGGPYLKLIAVPTTLSAAEYTVRSFCIFCIMRMVYLDSCIIDWGRLHKRHWTQSRSLFHATCAIRHHFGCRANPCHS
jgi:hypothetical protein